MHNGRLKLLLISAGLGSIIIGLPYIYRVFGPQESNVASWGYLSLFIGLISTFVVLFTRSTDSKGFKLILGLLFGFMAVIQVPPIAAWLLLHGHASLTDTPLQESFKVHWGFSIPHVIILAGSGVIVAKLFQQKTKG